MARTPGWFELEKSCWLLEYRDSLHNLELLRYRNRYRDRYREIAVRSPSIAIAIMDSYPGGWDLHPASCTLYLSGRLGYHEFPLHTR